MKRKTKLVKFPMPARRLIDSTTGEPRVFDELEGQWIPSVKMIIRESARTPVKEQARSYFAYFGYDKAYAMRLAMLEARLYSKHEEEANEHYRLVMCADAHRFIDALDITDVKAITVLLAGMVTSDRWTEFFTEEE